MNRGIINDRKGKAHKKQEWLKNFKQNSKIY